MVIKLDGIVARPADAQCQDEKGKSWPCGAAAKAALRRLVRARAVVCALPETAEQKSFTTRCAVSGTDISTWMVRQGWAKPNDPPEPALADAAGQRSPSVSAFGVELNSRLILHYRRR